MYGLQCAPVSCRHGCHFCTSGIKGGPPSPSPLLTFERQLFGEAQASINFPSADKWSFDSNGLKSAGF
jgi:hypothetical protein